MGIPSLPFLRAIVCGMEETLVVFHFDFSSAKIEKDALFGSTSSNLQTGLLWFRRFRSSNQMELRSNL